MKVRNYLESIANVGIYPVTTLLIFFIFFTILAVWVMRSRKSSYTEISNLPLESGEVNADTDQNPL